MKVILSRKGFDSKYGGYPSPILPDGRMLSLPIPSDDRIKYNDLNVDNDLTYFELMKQLKPRIKYNNKWHTLTENTKCHLDPDVNSDVIRREHSWKPLFGQINRAQTHLMNQGVKEGDLFLFFGTFRRTVKMKGSYSFDTKPEFHAIFGYLQTGKIIPIGGNTEIPDWMKYHPHANKTRVGKNNTIYVARDNLSWDPEKPGGGILNFNKKLILTKPGFSKSKWNLPEFIKECKISHHSKKSWNNCYFKSADIGQEFVIQENKKIEKWVKNLLNA